MAADTKRVLGFWALHVAGLWSIGVVQPIFEVLGNNPEFFVAHDTRGRDLIGLILGLCVVAPLCIVTLALLAVRIGRRCYQVMTWTALTLLVMAIALPVLKRSLDLGAEETFAVAGVVGVLAASAYFAFSPLRLFTTFLSFATVVVPIVFLFQSPILSLVSTTTQDPLPDVTFETTPPIVMLVFDQLPLPSLLDQDSQIDETLYPHFAELSRDASWFRNASAVGTLTHEALPALLTGNYPEEDRLPTMVDYPSNMFTLLGSTYRVEGFEPLTRLCPETVCPQRRLPFFVWYASVLLDLSVVYQHIVLPDELTVTLPPVTENWKDFVKNDTWRMRWRDRRTTDRRQMVHEFIESIVVPSSEDRPPFYFLHTLLPHEPWVYLPSGQQFTTNGSTVGLSPRSSRWTDDVVAVARNYQRHLLQVRYADALLGQVLDRMRTVGLYDDALLVVTADHGVTFRPGFPFRRPRAESFVDLVSVPLFIKMPNQQTGTVFASNVETIDIVPTVATRLGIRLPWEVDGVDAFDGSVDARAEKSLFFDDPLQRMTGPGDLGAAIHDVVARKYEWFEDPDGFHGPKVGRHQELLGRRVDEFEVVVSEDVQATVNFPAIFADVDRGSDFIPSHVSGAVRPLGGAIAINPATSIGVAVNGVLAGVTQVYDFPVNGRQHAWDVIINPQLVTDGSNTLEVFTIEETGTAAVVLARAYRSGLDELTANLIQEGAEVLWNVTASGFYRTEWAGDQPFRWTEGQASLVIPVDQETPPSDLSVKVLMTGPPTKNVRVSVNECTLFEGQFRGRWNRTFPLSGCSLGSEMVEIKLETETHQPSSNDTRELGLAVHAIELRYGGS
jgi:hypothetical protein